MKKGMIVGILVGLILLIIGGFFLFNSNSLLKISNSEESDTGNRVAGSEMPVPKDENVPEMIIEDDPVQNNVCSRVFSPIYSDSKYYKGQLFEAHTHLEVFTSTHDRPEGHDDSTQIQGYAVEEDKNQALEDAICMFQKEKIRGVIGFVLGDESIYQETIDSAKFVKEKSPGLINVFLSPAGFSAEGLNSVVQNNPGLIKGFGETAFYHPSYANNPPDSPEMMNIYKVAEKHDVIMMIHPNGNQEAEVENAVKSNPNVKFLIHGPEPEDYITNLINKYSNVYYSLDAILIRISPSPGALMYTVSSKEEFKFKFGQNYDKMMSDAIDKWKSRIEQHPNRFMWGTDRSDLWTYDEDVSILLEEFARDFIAELDPSVQEKFAYQNAEKLFE